MYCPNCGQQQISDDMRFCSRCGLALSGLMEWVTAGRLPAKSADYELAAIDSPRRKGIRRAAKLMFFSGVLFPVCLALALLIDEGALLLIPVPFFFASLVWMLYARLFSAKTAAATPPVFVPPVAQSPSFVSSAARAALTPATNLFIPPTGRQQVRTNELSQPTSVTENTTRLLDD
jgi:hypothetical protein